MALDVADCVDHHGGHTSLPSLVLRFEYVVHHISLVKDSIVHHAVVMICSFAFHSLHLREYHSKSLLQAFLLGDSVVMPT